MEQNLLTFHEKADELVEEAEELRGAHFNYLKESAQLLTEEGKLLSNLQSEDDYNDIDQYVNMMEKIVKRNLEIYGDLGNRIKKFKKLMQDEDEAHK